LENDYQSYQLDYRHPEDIDRRNVRVNLPHQIYYNIVELFYQFLDALKSDVMAADSPKNIEQLSRLMLFAKLFNIETGTDFGSQRGGSTPFGSHENSSQQKQYRRL